MEILNRYREPLALALDSLLGGPPSPILTMCRYHLGLADVDGTPAHAAVGKMLRPVLCLAICEALRGDVRQCLPAALSLEITHRASLVFDDIQDHSPQRNHRPTVWGVWGVDQAINAGLALTCYARLALHGMTNEGVSRGTILEVHRLLEETVLDLCRGQQQDVHYRTERPSLEQYLEMVRLKTGVLLGAACETGAIVAAVPEKRAAAKQLGVALGVAFQLRDDYLGAWGNPQEMGKAADDLKDREWSLPVLVGARLEGSADTIPTAIDWMVEEWTRRARGHLSEIGLPSGWLEMFVDITKALASRAA